jgi:hypothetical protein
MVHPADIQDRDGGVLLLSTLFGMYPFLKKLFADAGYQGPQFAKAVAQPSGCTRNRPRPAIMSGLRGRRPEPDRRGNPFAL